MVKKLIQRIFARIINSSLIIENPYIHFSKIENLLNERKLAAFKTLCNLNHKSKLYPEAKIINSQNNPELITIGANTHIRGELLIFKHNGSIHIGDNSYVGHNTNIRSANKISIGNNVLISHNCNIIDTNSHEINHLERAETYKKILKYGLPDKEYNAESAPIIIDDYAWLSFNVSILKGVKIGKGAIVGASSVVTKDVEPFTFVTGNPAKLIKRL